MEGSSRQALPPVERLFASSRLAEDLLSTVYERLLATDRRQEKWAEQDQSSNANACGKEAFEQEAMENFVTGGRS
jgi:hypothetical protein